VALRQIRQPQWWRGRSARVFGLLAEFRRVRCDSSGSHVINSVSSKTDFLVIGDDGNPCGTYTCYGRKIERAAELRRQGAKLMIIHESDLFDALADAS